MIEYSLWKRLKHFKSRSLFLKDFLGIFSFILLISLSVTIGFYNYYSGLAYRVVSELNYYGLMKVRDSIDLVSQEAEHLSTQISNDIYINNFLKQSKDITTSMDIVETMQSVQRVLSSYSSTSNYYMVVEIYSFNNDCYVDSTGFGTKSMNLYKTIPEIPKNKKIWVKVESKNVFDSSKKLVYYQKNFLRGETNPAGLITVSIDLNEFNKLIMGSSAKPFEEFFLIDQDDKILYASSQENIGKPAKKNIFLRQYLQDEKTKEEKFNSIYAEGKKMFVTEVDSTYKNWKCISFAATEKYYGCEDKNLKAIFIGSILFSLITAFLSAIWISSRVYQPIQFLLKLVENDNPLDVMNKNKHSGEVEIIIADILNKYEQNNFMKQQLINKQIMLNKAENIALQAQINPHFLYNTLENINWRIMTITGGKNEASEMIVMLSKLLRFYLKTEESIISVRDEIDYAKLYMELLRMRFGDTYCVKWEIDETLYDYKIVKTTLQPLLENAVNYGAKKGSGDDFISIRGFILEEDGIIEIINSGPALTDEQIKVINNELKDDKIEESKSIGMKNVNRRIKLHFGEKYGLCAMLNETGNTCMRISFPLK